MLRIVFEEEMGCLTLRVEGRFAGKHAEDAQKTIADYHDVLSARLVVNLTDATFIDRIGEAVLIWLGGNGAQFLAETPYSLCVCQRLNLKMAGKRRRGHAASKPRPALTPPDIPPSRCVEEAKHVKA